MRTASRFADFDGFEEFVGKSLGSVNAGRRFHAVPDEGESVEERFAEDDFRTFESLRVEDAAVRSWEGRDARAFPWFSRLVILRP